MRLLCEILGAALGVDLAHAFIVPLKNHKLCKGRGLDPYCGYTGKVPRFGARLVRPGVTKGR